MAFTHKPPTKKEKNKLLIGQKYFTALQKNNNCLFLREFAFFLEPLKTNASNDPDVFCRTDTTSIPHNTI